MPLVGYRTCLGGQQVEERLRAAGVEPRMAFRSDDNATLQAMVAAGMGIALVPRLTVNEADSRVAVIDLEGGAAAPDRPRLAPRPLPLAGGPGVRRGGARAVRELQEAA